MTETNTTASASGAIAVGAPAVTQLVLYTEQLEACRAFCTGLGLPLVRELYLARAGQTTGRTRRGLTVPAPPTRSRVSRSTDPDGRVVVLDVTPRPR